MWHFLISYRNTEICYHDSPYIWSHSENVPFQRKLSTINFCVANICIIFFCVPFLLHYGWRLVPQSLAQKAPSSGIDMDGNNEVIAGKSFCLLKCRDHKKRIERKRKHTAHTQKSGLCDSNDQQHLHLAEMKKKNKTVTRITRMNKKTIYFFVVAFGLLNK